MRHYINLFEALNAGMVDISNQNLTVIPEEYGVVTSNFECDNNQLTTLKNSPKEVGGSFWCNNNQLISLEGGPEEVGGHFRCFNNRLKTLKGVPKKIGNVFMCTDNPDLTPWEMRYILFTDLGGEFSSDHKEANDLVNKFMQLTPEEKQTQIQDYMMRLKEMK